MLKKWQNQKETEELIGLEMYRQETLPSITTMLFYIFGVHHFPSISALENNNWASLREPFKGMSPPMPHCWQGREPDHLIVYTCTQSRSGFKSWEPLWSFIQTHWAFTKACDLTHDPLAYIMTIPPAACGISLPPPQKPPSPPPRWCSPLYTLQEN